MPAVRVGDMLYLAGQIGTRPGDTSGVVPGGIEAETRQSLTSLSHVLEDAGSNMGLVVKTIVFLKDMNDFPRMNAIYGEFFPKDPPARSTIQAAALARLRYIADHYSKSVLRVG